MTVTLAVGQTWKGRLPRAKTITNLVPQERVDFIDSEDGKEWSQDWGTFVAWLGIVGAELVDNEGTPS